MPNCLGLTNISLDIYETSKFEPPYGIGHWWNFIVLGIELDVGQDNGYGMFLIIFLGQIDFHEI